jgi:type IV fimbrial biogenesis protein FimT
LKTEKGKPDRKAGTQRPRPDFNLLERVADPPVMKTILNNKLRYSLFSSFLYSSLKLIVRPYPLLHKGFSFIEVLVVMVIIGIMSTIAVPNLSTMMKSYRLKSAADDLASTLQLARMTAISQNAHSVITFNIANQTYSVFSDNGEGGGTINDGTQSGSEPTIKTIDVRNEYSNEVTMNTPSFGVSNFFNSQGMCNSGGSIVFQNTSGESRQVQIAQGGSVKVVIP